jgi:hypothetical protein
MNTKIYIPFHKVIEIPTDYNNIDQTISFTLSHDYDTKQVSDLYEFVDHPCIIVRSCEAGSIGYIARYKNYVHIPGTKRSRKPSYRNDPDKRQYVFSIISEFPIGTKAMDAVVEMAGKISERLARIDADVDKIMNALKSINLGGNNDDY